MQDFFIWMYQFLHGVQEDPLWDDVYFTSGWVLIFFTSFVLIFYYHILNRYFINWFKLIHWFLFMLINSVIVAAINVLIAINTIEPLEYSIEYLSFAIINLFYAAIFYSLFSLFFCFASPFAKYTPYKFYSKNIKD